MATNWLEILKTRIGYQGATSLADKLTAARAGYLDNINNAQLLNVPNLSTLSAARIGYLDNINQAGLLQVTAARAGYLDNIANAQLLNITAARLGYIDRLTLLAAGGAGEFTVARVGYLDNINQAGLLQVTAARAALLDQITALRMAELDAANIPADTDPKVMGRLQINATTIDLNQAAATYVLFTANAQDVVVEKLVIRMSGGAIAGAFTYLTIQTDDVTPIVLIDATQGAVANLGNEAQLAYTGAILLDAGTAAKIRLTIAVAQGGAARVCDVIAECRAVVAGGYLT